MSNPIKGMVAAISNYGIGKTTFALECGYHPKDIVFVNDDVKEVGFEDEFKLYIDLVSTSKKTKLLDFHFHCLDLIEQLPRSKVIIWDTWTQCQLTFPVYVKSHLGEFRNPTEWSANGKIKSGEIYQEAARYEGAALSELKKKCDLLILTFHLKQFYLGKEPVPGKYKPGHDKAIEKYADLRLWLTHNPDNQVPVGLIMKNIKRQAIADNRIKSKQVFPLRIPTCNWDSIWEYWENPIGNREPTNEERPNEFELSLISGTLTPEDKRLYEASLSLAEKREDDEQAEMLMVRQSQEKEIKEYISQNLNGLPGPVKLKAITDQIDSGNLVYDGEITIGKIGDWSK
jgi:hypothetical protein